MTRKLIVAAYLAAILLACTARTTTKRVIKQANKSAKTSETLKQPAVYLPTDSLLATAILKEMKSRRRKLNQQEIILAIARKFIGTPYVANTLEKNKDEKLVVNLRGMDCTTYLETVLALSRTILPHSDVYAIGKEEYPTSTDYTTINGGSTTTDKWVSSLKSNLPIRHSQPYKQSK